MSRVEATASRADFFTSRVHFFMLSFLFQFLLCFLGK